MSVNGTGKLSFSFSLLSQELITHIYSSFRIILDEAQSIKNKATKSAKAVYELQALTRFAMSGTPMMNNVGELFSLIHFLRIKPYCVQEKFNNVCFERLNMIAYYANTILGL